VVVALPLCCFDFFAGQVRVGWKEKTVSDTARSYDPTPCVNDPVFLLAILVAAKRSGDRLLARLIRKWMAEVGVRVTFTRCFLAPEAAARE
jgi:hypothetical protein